MKTLTIKQPWATLIAHSEKMIETRSWKTSYRGPLLIHAGKKIEADICRMHPFTDILSKHNIVLEQDMPVGVIIAKCELVACQKIIEDDGICGTTDGHLLIKGNEYCFGDYTPGRYAWIFQNIKLIDEPIPAKGKLSLWEFDFNRG